MSVIMNQLCITNRNLNFYKCYTAQEFPYCPKLNKFHIRGALRDLKLKWKGIRLWRNNWCFHTLQEPSPFAYRGLPYHPSPRDKHAITNIGSLATNMNMKVISNWCPHTNNQTLKNEIYHMIVLDPCYEICFNVNNNFLTMCH